MEHTIRDRCYECGSANVSAHPSEDYPDHTMASRMRLEAWEVWCANCERILQRAHVLRDLAEDLRGKVRHLNWSVRIFEEMAKDADAKMRAIVAKGTRT